VTAAASSVMAGRMPRRAAVAFLVRAELIKLRTTRTAIGFLLGALAVVLLTLLVQTLASDPSTVDDKRNALAGASVVGGLLVVFGAVGAAGEYRHGTITPTLLAAPDRVRALLAKLAAYLIAGLALGIVLQGISFAVGVPLLADNPGSDLASDDYLNLGVGGVLSAGVAAMIGVAIGTVVRNQVAAVIGTLAYLLVIEPLIPIANEDLLPWTLGGSLSALGGTTFDHSKPWGEAGLVLLGWTVVLCLAAILVDRRRDVS
jgi:ABC-type transport system involved in multi-copper enzyme maturation permease subunit